MGTVPGALGVTPGPTRPAQCVFLPYGEPGCLVQTQQTQQGWNKEPLFPSGECTPSKHLPPEEGAAVAKWADQVASCGVGGPAPPPPNTGKAFPPLSLFPHLEDGYLPSLPPRV